MCTCDILKSIKCATVAEHLEETLDDFSSSTAATTLQLITQLVTELEFERFFVYDFSEYEALLFCYLSPFY